MEVYQYHQDYKTKLFLQKLISINKTIHFKKQDKANRRFTKIMSTHLLKAKQSKSPQKISKIKKVKNFGMNNKRKV